MNSRDSLDSTATTTPGHDAALSHVARLRRGVKQLLLWVYLYCGYIQLRDFILGAFGRARAVVVYYHRIGGCDVLSRPGDQFAADIEYLQGRYECIAFTEFCRRIKEGVPLTRPVAVITFDDGYRDNFTAAVPILKEANVAATFFVSTGFIDTGREFPHDAGSAPRAKLTWEDLRQMERLGFEIGSHTVEHIDLGAADQHTIRREVTASLDQLNCQLGHRPRAFSYPWGKPDNIPAAAVRAVKEAGYHAAASAYGGSNGRNTDLFNIRRVDVGNGHLNRLAFRARVAGLDLDYLKVKLAGFAARGRREPICDPETPARRQERRSSGPAAIASRDASLRSKGARASNLLALLVTLAGVASLTLGIGRAAGNALYVSPLGKDSNPATMSRPVLTIGQAVEMARPGDTIYLRAGQYSIRRFIWIGKPNLTISSYPGERAEIIGSTEESDNSPTSIIVIASDHVALVDLDIQGGSYYGVKVDVEGSNATTGVQIRRCRIHHTGRDCIKTFNADNLLIEDCEIGPSGVRDPSNAEGIDSIGSVGVTIRRCYVHDTATNGVYLKGGARNGVVERCRIEKTGRFGGILLGQDTDEEYMRDGSRYEAIDCVARNNLVVSTGAAGLGTYSGSNVRFENNTLWDIARNGQAGFWIVTNSREVPPRRVTFNNNIVAVLSGRPMVFALNLTDQLAADGNIYHSGAGAPEFRRELTAPGVASSWRFDDWKRFMRADGHSRVVNPMLDPAARFVPKPMSPAIDSGLTLPDVREDLIGTPRPQGAGYDVGAYESSAAVSHSEGRTISGTAARLSTQAMSNQFRRR
jgi:peptidoglycan/xylan/chitin deacetylase (PgdA/CDA1 family)